MNEIVRNKGVADSLELQTARVGGSAGVSGVAQIKNDVLAAIMRRIEGRSAQVELAATLYGFAQFNRHSE
jgi:hypothetical protein